MRVNSLALAAAAAIGVMTAGAEAAVVLSENFDSYNDGNLVGQGGWTQLGSSVVNPLQVTAAKNVPMTTGQDAQKAFTSTVTKTDGHALVYDFDLSATSGDPDAGGDFFMSVNSAIGVDDYAGRIYAAAGTQAGTFRLAMTGPPIAAESRVFGADLNFNTTYHITATWNFIAGAANDTFTIEVNDAPYVAQGWIEADAEPTSFGVLTFRQGGADASSVVVDNVVITEVVPEPTSLALLGLGAMGLLARRRSGGR